MFQFEMMVNRTVSNCQSGLPCVILKLALSIAVVIVLLKISLVQDIKYAINPPFEFFVRNVYLFNKYAIYPPFEIFLSCLIKNLTFPASLRLLFKVSFWKST